MDLFDSATAEMKRMRNQRKHGSVLEQMKINAAEVEPTEAIFYPDGQLRKTRHIFDSPSSDSSPVSTIAFALPHVKETFHDSST